MERPARKTKVVNYCEGKDFDDDEDFACVKAPPSKKAREEVKPERRTSSGKSSSQESVSGSTAVQTSRKPLEERLRDRDLEAAITLSLLDNAVALKEQSHTSRGVLQVQILTDENTDPSSLHRSNCSVDPDSLGLDQITAEQESSAASKQRPAAAKTSEESRRRQKNEDDDYEPKLAPGPSPSVCVLPARTCDGQKQIKTVSLPDSDSDEDFSEPADSEDEEFTVHKTSKNKKKAAKSEKSRQPPASKREKPTEHLPLPAAASTPGRNPPAAPKRPASSAPPPPPRPSGALSPAGGRIPRWTPPGQIGKSPPSSQRPAGRSPGQGLRLGLSRLVRVKPLHPSVPSH
ncbi:uncharacterized protein V6R79_009618 [Siganus canaliculatus]